MKKELKKLQRAKQERKEILLKHAGVIIAGLIIALGIHFYVIDDNDISKLKTSVRDIGGNQVETSISDLYFEKINSDYIALKTSKSINSIAKLSFSITYNPEDIQIESIIPTNSKTKILNLANIPGINTTILEWGKQQDLNSGDTLVEIKTNKLSEILSPLNIIVETIEFSDIANDSYSPTTSGIRL
ncbi:hypothetical protein OAN96_01440 [Candidatus Gracilibacteria bacterium]|nr:hypothetical protein [Candidatus Gracilibacteria bacterium]